MNFVSVEFFYFILAVVSIYFLLGHRWQNRFLLIASYLFYGWWDYRFLTLIFLSSVIDFYCVKIMLKKPDKKRFFLMISLFANLGTLSFFKYFGFFSGSLVTLLNSIGLSVGPILLEVILPVGISFYTFQTLSYTIDVYRGELKECQKFEDFLLYVSFFPQLVAGPIERASRLLPQIQLPRKIFPINWNSGGQLILNGFFKKMVIADNLAGIVNPIFSASNPTSGEIILASYAFAFQIYCDFSGYTDIARGVARILGFELCLNFNSPYLSHNPAEFWRRWHISLSTWLRDYLYISLGGNRVGKWLNLRNLMLTMVLGGLWHGAAWTYIIWGAYQGALLCIHRALVPSLKKYKFTSGYIWKVSSIVLFFQFCCFGWLIFRANSVEQLLGFAGKVFSLTPFIGGGRESWTILGILVLPLLGIHIYQELKVKLEPWMEWRFFVRWPINAAILYSILYFGAPTGTDFIYFQF